MSAAVASVKQPATVMSAALNSGMGCEPPDVSMSLMFAVISWLPGPTWTRALSVTVVFVEFDGSHVTACPVVAFS